MASAAAAASAAETTLAVRGASTCSRAAVADEGEKNKGENDLPGSYHLGRASQTQ
jgi:hypothetical protein